MNNNSPVARIAAALKKRGVKIGDGKNVKDPSHLADLIEVACANYAGNAPARRFARMSHTRTQGIQIPPWVVARNVDEQPAARPQPPVDPDEMVPVRTAAPLAAGAYRRL